MIAIDTNALVRMLIEDDAVQTKAVQNALIFSQIHSIEEMTSPDSHSIS